MITTLTCNPAIDKFYLVRSWSLHQATRLAPGQVKAVAGGKGINVARVLRRLGVPVMATGIVGGFTGAWIRHCLDREGIPHEFIQVEEESRIHMTILEQEGAATELLEPGPTITPEDEEELIYTVRFLAGQSQAVVLSGSLPPGAAVDLYARLAEVVRQAGATVVLDAHGEPLRQGLAAIPFLVKPNRTELEELVGRPLLGEEAVLQAGQQLVDQYRLPWLIVSLGKDGALAWYGGKTYRLRSPAVKVVSAVGSGDAMVGGFLAAWQAQRPPVECLRYAVATAAANVTGVGSGWIDPAQVKRLEAEVEVETLG